MNGKRGFANIEKERLREIARLGGVRSHQLGRAHTWTSEEAQAAGRKGGRKGGRISRRRAKVELR